MQNNFGFKKFLKLENIITPFEKFEFWLFLAPYVCRIVEKLPKRVVCFHRWKAWVKIIIVSFNKVFNIFSKIFFCLAYSGLLYNLVTVFSQIISENFFLQVVLFCKSSYIFISIRIGSNLQITLSNIIIKLAEAS